jgi:uncharacterized protein
MGRGADVVTEAGQRELGGATATPGLSCTFEDFDLEPRPGQDDCSSQAVRPRTDNDCIERSLPVPSRGPARGGGGSYSPEVHVSVDPYMVLASAVVGLLVGITGAGGGALMTPMLILLFNVKPSAAISSDLVAAVVMRPVGAVVHLHKGTVNLRLVGWLVVGSVPLAFFGAYLLHLLGHSHQAEDNVEIALGAALLVGAAAMVFRGVLDRRRGEARTGVVHHVSVRPLPTVAVGMAGGLIVGMTSVGSGSLMIVLLLFLYPMLGANQLVGTDLTQAVPLTLAAALGALAFGHVELAVTASLVIGSVPAVLVGSFLSSRAPDRYIRPVITFVIFASGLKYVGMGTTTLGWTLCAVILVAGSAWMITSRPWREQTPRQSPLQAEADHITDPLDPPDPRDPRGPPGRYSDGRSATPDRRSTR